MKEQKFFMNGIFRDTPEGPWPYATRCKKCGATFFPAEQICNQCLSEDMEQFNLPKYGTLYTYTVLYRPVNAYPVPHCICEIDYPEEKLLVKGIIEPDDPTSLEKGNEFKIGSKVELFVDKLWEEEDKDIIGYKFRIVGGVEK